MNEIAASARYRIRVRGVLSQTLLGAFPGLAAETDGGDTVLEGTLLDQAALFGVVGQIEALGLELLEICHSHDPCDAASPAPPRTSPRSTTSRARVQLGDVMTTRVTNEQLLVRNLLEVFDERDAATRAQAIAAIHAPDVAFYETDQVTRGHEALGVRVQTLLNEGPGFVFRASSELTTNHDLERLAWQFGPDGGEPAVTGTDIAVVSDGRIASLYTFIDG